MSEADDELYDFALSVCSWAADVDKVVSALRAAERRGRIAGLREAAEIANTVGQSPPAQMRLQAGECTAQEIRTARVFVCLAETRIRARANALEASE